MKELEEKVSRNNGSEAWNQERTRLKTIIDEKNSEIEQLQKEAHVLSDQMDHLRKEVRNTFYIPQFFISEI